MTPEQFIENPRTSVVIYPDDVLTTPAAAVEDLGVWNKIGEIMEKVMVENNGIGLAAPQVALPYRAFVIRFPNRSVLYINPEIVSTGNLFTEDVEGCLSLPGIQRQVVRAKKVKVKWKQPDGKEKVAMYEGLPARVFQHELDHLNGKLIIS